MPPTASFPMGRLALVLPALAAAVASPLPAQTAAAPDLPRHELIFARHADEARSHYDIWRMCADGTQLASLVVEPGTQFQIAVSPDGSEMVYASRTDGAQDLWRRPIGKGAAVNLTNNPARDSGPAYAPDGKRLAFFSERDAERQELYVMTLADGAIERLTHNEQHDSGAAWAPTGDAIVFTRYTPEPEGAGQGGSGELVRIDLATREERQLTALGGYNFDADFSPDGAEIAFHRTADGGSEIWVMGADGSSPRPLTDTFIDEYTPRWSPDGEWIAFTAGVGSDGLGTFDLWLMRRDGSDRRVLNPAANTEGWQVWRRGEHYCR